MNIWLFATSAVVWHCPALALLYAHTHENNNDENCETEEVRNCFQQAFVEVRPMVEQSQKRDCQNYATYLYCFDMSFACSETQLAELASREYHRMKGIYQPKESFLATYGAVKQQCENPCQSGHDWSCRSRMGPAAQDKDQAIYMELGGQARQIELKLVSTALGCSNFEHNMQRWMEFRSAICPDLAPCSCQEPRLEAALRVCGVRCKDLIRKRSIYYLAKTSRSCLNDSLVLTIFTIFIVGLTRMAF